MKCKPSRWWYVLPAGPLSGPLYGERVDRAGAALVTALTLDLATRLLAAGEEAARRAGLALAVRVVDAGGHLVALHRMDGAPWIAPEVASARRGRPPPTAPRAPRRARR